MPAMDHTQGLSDYLALGPDRSQKKLWRIYRERYRERAPAIETIKAWSVKHGWAALAESFDAKAKSRLIERTQTIVVANNLSRVEALSMVATQCLDDAAAIRVDADGASAQDKKALMSAAIEAIKMIEVLSGGVSDRQEKVAAMSAQATGALRELEARARRRELAPVVIDVTPAHAETLPEAVTADPPKP